MKWLKDAWLDVVVLLIIGSFAFYPNTVLNVVIWVYTSLLLISKVLSLFMPSLQRKAQNSSAPSWFYHFIYGLTVAILFYAQYYYLSGAWLLVWILSTYSFIQTRSSEP